jgi:predicted  nucleic acid-binding Zn-ribbon protein
MTDYLVQQFTVLSLEGDLDLLEGELQKHLEKMEEWCTHAHFTFDEDQEREERLRQQISQIKLDLKMVRRGPGA